MSNVRDLLERFAIDRDALHRALPPSFAPAHQERLSRFYDEWQDAIDTVDFDALSHDEQADAALFRNLLDRERFDLHIAEQRRNETASLLPFTSVIVELNAELRQMARPNPIRAAEQLDAIRNELDEKTKDMASGSVISPVTAERAARTIQMMRDTLDEWFRFFDGYDPLFTWWVREPYHTLNAALDAYAKCLREIHSGSDSKTDEATIAAKADSAGERDEAETIIGDPIGDEALRAALERELIPYSPDELIAIGDREFAWCEQEMRRAANVMGHGDDWQAALETVKTHHVAPGEQPDMVRDLALEAIAFLDARDLVTIPPLCREIWRMGMMSPEAQKINPFFLGGETIQVSFRPTA